MRRLEIESDGSSRTSRDGFSFAGSKAPRRGGGSRRLFSLLVLVGLFTTPLTADTLTGTVYRDLDADGTRSAEERGVADVRLLVYAEDGWVLAQGRSGSDGSFELTVDAAAGTPVRVTAAGLQGRFMAKSSPEGAVALTGGAGRRRVDLALVAAGELARPGTPERRRSAFDMSSAEKAAEAAPEAPTGSFKVGFPNGLPYPNVGPWVTMRCAGGNNLFDIDVADDDRLESVYAQTPKQNSFSLFGYPYTFVSVPGQGERCRVLSPTEHGAVEPAGPPPPTDPPGGVGSGG